ncbi:glycoside hydrolase family 2 protein [Paenibacillus lignilyticus]|uniref:Glycoside hydrolase family 2 n=1 Tax=Paenibacillus lignilyticus TaxID=1172615 RepID=A0ABS5CFX7_9BACL|nr:sugar-binding domain-containing protein [Paenibacillus lignilyticus]MBP3964748.1 glycoside hydrolase family 2 [Paenibacillus lignilyticus]
MINGTNIRPEYPRPSQKRNRWLSLNGEWDFAFDDERKGESDKWYKNAAPFYLKIQVPFAYQSTLSGIGDASFHDVVWYRKMIHVPSEWSGQRIILHFGAVDYKAKVWVNEHLAVTHEGGHTPFRQDITDLLKDGGNVITVRAEDDSLDLTQPRGKQYWEEQSASIFYTRTTGIWQSVWLEPVHAVHIDKLKYKPDIDRNEIEIRTFMSEAAARQEVWVEAAISFDGKAVAEERFKVNGREESRTIRLHDFNDHGLGRWWSPEKPNLYDVRFRLSVDGKIVDEFDSYFGMRKVSIENGKFNLNNRPYFMRLVLDQGYFPDGILTPPSEEAILKDVELTKAMGFNGVRKHQKTEDPLFLYHCDRNGLLVWGECANAYQYSEAYVGRFTREWHEIVERDYNHPCIVAWVPINESWGVPNIQIDVKQQQHALAMYHLVKSLDETRPVIGNDGWEMLETDLVAIHDYEWREEVLAERYVSSDSAIEAMPANRRIFVGGASYKGQPIMVTEFGGISFRKSDWEGWGYSGASDDEDFLKRLNAVFRPLLMSPVVQAVCYTQLTDVEQEINGLLTYDRVPKVPLEAIRQIVTGQSNSQS